jgi:hypothetical protein
VFPATLAAIHPRVRLLQSADDILLMMSSSRHFSFLSCLQNSRKAKETVDFLETMKNRGLRWVVSGAPPYRGNPRDSVEHQELEPIDFGASLRPE